MSAAMWISGMLQHDHGVDLSTISWVQGAIDGPGSHGSQVFCHWKQPDVVNKTVINPSARCLKTEKSRILSAMMPGPSAQSGYRPPVP